MYIKEKREVADVEKKIERMIELIKQMNEIMKSLRIPEEILDRKIKPFGNASHIILPRKYSDKEAKVIIKR